MIKSCAAFGPFGKAMLLAGAAALLAPFSASAQEVRDLDRARSDVLIFNGEVTTQPVVYRYTMAAGTSLRVDAIPAENSELDPVLTITDVATGEVLAEDDDGGEGLASRARITTETRRRVEISVTSFAFLTGEETAGAFELQLRPAEWHPQATRTVARGDRVDGSLDVNGSQLFSISGEEGQLLEVALIAREDSLDPTLTLYAGRGNEGEQVAFDDDGGNNLNSMLRVVLPSTGVFTIEAKPYGDTSGDFTLRVAEAREHGAQATEQVLGLGQTATGYVGPVYEEEGVDPTHVSYQLSPEAIAAIRAGNGEVTFNMAAVDSFDEDFPSAVDSFLELGFDTPLGFAAMMSDDDGGEGLNSRIAVDLGPLASNGDWLERLRVRASSIGSAGAYEIEMVEGLQEVESDDYYEEAVDVAADAVEAAAEAVDD